MIQREMSKMTDSPQISFVWLGEQCCRSPGAGQIGAVAGREGCTPYL